MALVPRISSSSVTVNGSTWECVCPSSVVTVTFRSVVPVVGITSFNAEIRGRVSSFWSLGVPIFFHVDLNRRLQDAPVSTKNGNFRFLMVTGTDGDDVVVSSSLLMVGFVTRLTLDDFCFVMQAVSMCPFLPQNLQTGLDNPSSHGLSFHNNNTVSVFWMLVWKMVMTSDGDGTASLFGSCGLTLVLSTLGPLLFWLLLLLLWRCPLLLRMLVSLPVRGTRTSGQLRC